MKLFTEVLKDYLAFKISAMLLAWLQGWIRWSISLPLFLCSYLRNFPWNFKVKFMPPTEYVLTTLGIYWFFLAFLACLFLLTQWKIQHLLDELGQNFIDIQDSKTINPNDFTDTQTSSCSATMICDFNRNVSTMIGCIAPQLLTQCHHCKKVSLWKESSYRKHQLHDTPSKWFCLHSLGKDLRAVCRV